MESPQEITDQSPEHDRRARSSAWFLEHLVKSEARAFSLGQGLPARFGREWDQQHTHSKRDRCVRHGSSNRSHAVDHRSDREIRSRAEKTAERRLERKRRGPYGRVVLLGQPQSENREVAAEKSKHEKSGDKRL